jgi:hypothetical protein
MGLILIAKGASFSSVSVGSLRIFTSITSGLLALFRTTDSSTKAIINKGLGVDGTVFGVPVVGAASMAADGTKGVNFGFAPTGSHTVSAVFKIRPGAITTSYPVGAFNGLNGSEYFKMTTTQVIMEATGITEGGVFGGNVEPALTKPAEATFEMYVARLENGVRVCLDHPRTGVVSTAGTANNFNYPSPVNYCAGANIPGALDDFSVFAYWDRVLSDAEVAIFYNEIKTQMAAWSTPVAI